MKKPLPPKRQSAPPIPSMPAPKTVAKKKVFAVKRWDSSDMGKKIMIYSDTGMGKTSLAMLAPNPVFLGIDEGGRELTHPITGLKSFYIPEIENFQDVRNALRQPNIFENYETVVIDTVTILEDWAVPHMLENILLEKGGRAANIVAYGYNKGYQHLYDLMKSILCDCDALVHKGKNVILIAQAIPNKVSNPGGDDYLRDGPRLYAGKPSVEALYCEWVDYIFRIDYENIWVSKQNKNDTKGKVTGETIRVIYTKPEVYFRAKSKNFDESIVSFADKNDDSLWKFLFGE